MKIQRKQGWLLLLCTLFFVSCEEENITLTGSNGVVQGLKLDTSALMFVQNAGTKTLDITSSAQWAVKVPDDANWCEAKPAGDDKLQVSVSENTETQLRETLLTLTAGNEQKTLLVRQTGTTPHIEFVNYTSGGETVPLTDNQEVVLLYDATDLAVEVFANIPYEVITASWIKNAPASGIRAMENSTIKFTVEKNSHDKDRGVEITFKQKEGDYYVFLPVKQRKNLGSLIELTEDMFTVTQVEGKLKIQWNFPTGTVYEKIIFEYDNKRTPTIDDKAIKEVMYTAGNEVIIDNLLAKDGEYIFKVEVLNADGESLIYNDGGFSFNGGKCMPVPAYDKTVKTKIDLSAKATDSDDVDGLRWLSFNGIGSGTKYENLVDGDIETHYETGGAGIDDFIVIEIPDGVQCDRFTIRTANRTNQVSQAPGIYTISVCETNSSNENDWELVFEQKTKTWIYEDENGVVKNFGRKPTDNAEMNRYRYKTLEPMSSKTGKSFKFIKYFVTDRNNDAPRNDYFNLAELELYAVSTVRCDPENE